MSRKSTKYTKQCCVCGKDFDTVPSSSKQHTCSRECYAEKRRLSRIKLCKNCGSEFDGKKGRVTCSRQCSAEYRWKGHVSTSHLWSKVITREQMKSCNRCGYNKHPEILERHHIDRDRSNNSEDNLEILCPNCHAEDHLIKRDGRFKWCP